MGNSRSKDKGDGSDGHPDPSVLGPHGEFPLPLEVAAEDARWMDKLPGADVALQRLRNPSGLCVCTGSLVTAAKFAEDEKVGPLRIASGRAASHARSRSPSKSTTWSWWTKPPTKSWCVPPCRVVQRVAPV